MRALPLGVWGIKRTGVSEAFKSIKKIYFALYDGIPMVNHCCDGTAAVKNTYLDIVAINVSRRSKDLAYGFMHIQVEAHWCILQSVHVCNRFYDRQGCVGI